MATFDLFRNNGVSKAKNTIDKSEPVTGLIVKSGLKIAAFLLIIFVIACPISEGLEIYELSLINMFVLAIGLFLAIRRLSPSGKFGTVDYFEGFKVGMLTSIVAVITHSLFLLVYTLVNPSVLVKTIYVNPISVAGVTFIEGMAESFLLTFCIMQYFKKDS